MNKFQVICADSFIWNYNETVEFLVAHQNQHIYLDLNNEAPDCEVIGLYRLLDNFDFAGVIIQTQNQLETHNQYGIEYVPMRYLNVRKPVDAMYHVWNKQKIFSAYYGRPLWHRLALATHLYVKHRDRSLINLRGNFQDPDNRKLFEIQDLFYQAPEQFKDFAKLVDHLPLLVEEQDGYTPGVEDTSGFTDQLLDFYTQILIDIVTESYTSGNIFYPTEKTFRPMLMKKPFIAMAPRNFLIYLRQMGFRTFHDFWSEDYDGYDATDKFQHIVKLIDYLATRSIAELETMYNKMQPILDHNYNMLLEKTYTEKITRVQD
jgi:hypothetical protein